MEFLLKFTNKSIKDLNKITNVDKIHIIEELENDLAFNPGKDKPLQGIWKNHYSYRIGKYRVIYQIIHKEITILIIKVGHRRDVYD